MLSDDGAARGLIEADRKCDRVVSYAVCGARRKQAAARCRRPAGWGTLHPGVGRAVQAPRRLDRARDATAAELARRYPAETGVQTTAGEYCHGRLQTPADAGEAEPGDRPPSLMHWLRTRDRPLSQGCKTAAMMIKPELGAEPARKPEQ